MVNHMVLQGRLTRDPELRTTNSGTPVCSFTVAWSEKYKDNEQKLFMPCTAWRAAGEMVSRHFAKGKEIAVEGRLSTRDWTDKEGNKRQSIELTVDRVHFCGPKAPDSADLNPSSVVPPTPHGFVDIGDDGELPF